MKTAEQKKDLLRKYAEGLTQIWQRLIDQGPEQGNPLDLFLPAIDLTEASLAKLMQD